MERKVFRRKRGRMEKERKRQPTLLLPQGLGGLLMFTSRISIKMGGGVCVRVFVIFQFVCFGFRWEKEDGERVCVHLCNWWYVLSMHAARVIWI